MIRLRGLSHAYRNGQPIFSDVDLDIPTDRRVALLGHKNAGKSTLAGLLTGMIKPSSGFIDRRVRVSFLAGYQGGFRLTHTGRQNIFFAARAYGANEREVFEFVKTVTDLNGALDKPMRDLSLQTRIGLSYALTYALPFDAYVFDNIVGPVGSDIPDFFHRCRAMFEARALDSGLIISTRNAAVAEQYCDCAVVIHENDLLYFENVYDAIWFFDRNGPGASNLADDFAGEDEQFDEDRDELSEFGT
jgi:capsular polysaccharide transport system ATP-binding protein